MSALRPVVPVSVPVRVAVILFTALVCAGCTLSTHPELRSELGVTRGAGELLAVIDRPGTVEVETITACDWSVDRSGLINLDHPTARTAGLKDGPESIQVYFHVLRHPERGIYLIDTGFEKALRDAPDRAAMRGIIAAGMHLDRMKFLQPMGDWLATQAQPPAGVFLTHAHLDHLGGLPDLPATTPIWSGPGELTSRGFLNLFVQGSSDRALAGKPPVQTWRFEADPSGRFEGVLDVFGDGMVWALWVPGHTPGSTAYLVRTPHGPVLMVGDASHSRWGWEHDVEPGSFSDDIARSADSFRRLRGLVAEHPAIEVRLGHQR